MSKLPETIAEYGKEHKAIYSRIFRAIKRYDRIAVFRHIKPDYDALGSQWGLATFIKDNFPSKEVICPGDNHVDFSGKLYPLADEVGKDWFDKPFLAIIVDVGDHLRVADPRYRKAKYKVKIDHHPAEKEIAKKATLLDIQAAAAAEMITDLLLHFKGTFISKEAARYLYTAIVGDSGRFQYSTTNLHTFQTAEELIKTGFNLQETYLAMYEKSQTSLRNMAYVLAHYKISPHGCAYYVMSDEVLKELGITNILGKEHLSIFSNIEGVGAWCSITEDVESKDHCWRISLRSKFVDVSKVANKWDGGGHAQASGAKLKDISQLDDFIADMDALLEEAE